MATDWLLGDHPAAAVERILDAAGRCFAEGGVTRTTIGDIARAAGCSRPTIYRYFEDRDTLRIAFVHREARGAGARIAAAVDTTADPATRLVDAMLAALEEVRGNPVLAAWFTGDQRSAATEVAASSDVIEAITAAFLGDPADDDTRERARWVVRIILSLLSLPAADPDEERHLLERYLAPVVTKSEQDQMAVMRREGQV